MKAKLTFALVMLFMLLAPAKLLASEVTVTIDGIPVYFSGQQPAIIDGRTLVPVRGVFEQLGFVPTWDSVARTATLTRSDFTIEITIGSNVFISSGTEHILDVHAQIINGSTMLPLRAVLESVGYSVGWNSATRTVVIETTPASATGMVRAGDGHSMYITPDGNLWAWGWNDFSQVGGGARRGTDQTTPLHIMENVATVSGGFGHTVVLATNGNVYTWGFNTDGQIGNGSWLHRTRPFMVMDNMSFATAGCQHTMAITNDGVLWGWGSNMYGQLGVPRPEGGGITDGLFNFRPVRVMENIVYVSAGFSHTMAIDSNGVLWGFGNNINNQINSDTETRYHHTPVRVMDDVVAVSAGGGVTFAITSDGTLWGWGANFVGLIGDGTTINRPEPVRVMDNVVKVASARGHTMAIDANGVLWGWGGNSASQLGDGTTIDRHSPVRIMDNVVDVGVTIFHTLALTADGVVWGWGGNMVNQINDDAAEVIASPVRVIE